jgi:hypothetical protein
VVELFEILVRARFMERVFVDGLFGVQLLITLKFLPLIDMEVKAMDFLFDLLTDKLHVIFVDA